MTRAELDRIMEEEIEEEGGRGTAEEEGCCQGPGRGRLCSPRQRGQHQSAREERRQRNLDEAVTQISAVTLEEQAAMDKHPEKRVRAAYKVSPGVLPV